MVVLINTVVQASIQDLKNNGEDPVTFTSLCPWSSTRCMKAATTFQGLLKLERAGKMVSTQKENFAEIIISIVWEALYSSRNKHSMYNITTMQIFVLCQD